MGEQFRDNRKNCYTCRNFRENVNGEDICLCHNERLKDAEKIEYCPGWQSDRHVFERCYADELDTEEDYA